MFLLLAEFRKSRVEKPFDIKKELLASINSDLDRFLYKWMIQYRMLNGKIQQKSGLNAKQEELFKSNLLSVFSKYIEDLVDMMIKGDLESIKNTLGANVPEGEESVSYIEELIKAIKQLTEKSGEKIGKEVIQSIGASILNVIIRNKK